MRWSKKKLKPACEAHHHGRKFSLFATQGSVLFSGCATSLLASMSAFSYDSITANSLSSGEARGANGSGSGFQCNHTPGYLIRTFSVCCHCHLPPRKWVVTCIFIISHAKVSLVKRTDIRRAWGEGSLWGDAGWLGAASIVQTAFEWWNTHSSIFHSCLPCILNIYFSLPSSIMRHCTVNLKWKDQKRWMTFSAKNIWIPVMLNHPNNYSPVPDISVLHHWYFADKLLICYMYWAEADKVHSSFERTYCGARPITFNKHSILCNLIHCKNNFLKGIVHPKIMKMYSSSDHQRCRWVCFFIGTYLEKFCIT